MDSFIGEKFPLRLDKAEKVLYNFSTVTSGGASCKRDSFSGNLPIYSTRVKLKTKLVIKRGDGMPRVFGDLLGGVYRILSVLGAGGNGTVYLARHERAGRLWAVKEIPKSGNTLILEAEILKKLSHPGLPAVGDILDEDGMLYLVMDYIEGKSLRQITEEEGVWSQEEAVSVGKQLCRVLAYLHGQDPPVIYRDMKPSNVMRKPDGQVVLVDFGTARERKKNASGDTECLGTRGYAAPEQYSKKGQTGPETDVYGLGVLLYYLLTGKEPSEPPYGLRPVRSLRRELSGGLERIIGICTKDAPEERYPSCQALLEALTRYEGLERKADGRRKSRRKPAAGLFAFLFLAAGLFGVLRQLEQEKAEAIYEAYLEDAKGSIRWEQEKAHLEKAILEAPMKAEAYIRLAEGFLKEDGTFSAEEEGELQEILRQEKEGKTCLAWLTGRKESYGQVAYEIGILYFYYYEGSGGKGASARWLSAAASHGREAGLGNEKQRRATILGRIASYYDWLDFEGRTEDRLVSYRIYWEDLNELAKLCREEEGDQMTAVTVYRELVFQIAFHGNEFYSAGVSVEDMEEQLEEIERKQSLWETEEEKAPSYRAELLEEMKDGLEMAKQTVRTISQEGKGRIG